MHESAYDAVDGSSTGTEVPQMVGAVDAPTIATDAEAICEAVDRAKMRLVPTKTPEQQSGLVLHRRQHLFIRQQTSVINAIRAHCAEFGIVASVGRRGVEELLIVIANENRVTQDKGADSGV